MSRWHQTTCTRPDVAVVGGLPCCRWCYAVASIDDVAFAPPLSTRNRPNAGDDNGDYKLRWPKCVEYMDEDETSNPPAAFLPSSTTDEGHQDQGRSTDYGAFSPFQSPFNKDHDLTKVRQARTNNHPYQPSRCYPVFWASDEIRVLELDSGTTDSLLHGVFSRVQVGSERAQYEAVSYTWADEFGDSTRSRPMFIGPFWDIVPITRNCENALRSVRIFGGPPRNIWIDSLCINQDNEKERSDQVALMPRIYAGAVRVLVYLGTATWDSDLAMDAITHSEDRYQCVHLGTRSGVCEGCFKAVESLFQRRFFERLWVVQEVTLAQSLAIFCGSKSAHWPPNHVTDHLPISLWTKSHEQRQGDPGFELLGLIADTSRCVCSNSRDRVFALLGMLHGLEEGAITADYSLTLHEISIGIASFLVQTSGRGREVLLYAGINRFKRRCLPSWVPDFVEPLKPDWKIRGLLDRSLAISGDLWTEALSAERKKTIGSQGAIQSQRLSLPPFCLTGTRVHARRASLCLPAVKLCNLTDSFKPFGSGRDFQPFVRHGSTQRAVVLVPRAVSGFNDLSSWLSIVCPEDGLYWLQSFDGFAILRPNNDQVSHRLICGCDVYFENVEDWDKSQQSIRQAPGQNWSLQLRTLSASDDAMCSSQLARLLQKASISFGIDGISGEERFNANAADLLLDIGFMVKRPMRQAAKAMWESWQRFEKNLLPLFQCDAGLEIIRKTLQGVIIMRCGVEDDGRPREVYAFQGCFMRSFEAIAALIWSILPSTTPVAYEESRGVLPIISSIQLLKDLQDWADLTKSLFAPGGPLSTSTASRISSILFWDVQVQWETRLSSFQKLLEGIDPLVATQDMLSLFQEPDIAEGKCFREPLLSLTPMTKAYVKAHRTQSLWNWNLCKKTMERWESFWKAMEEDTWLNSWCLHDEAMEHDTGLPPWFLYDELPEVGKGKNKEADHRGLLARALSTNFTPKPLTLNTLEQQLAIRLWLREFDLNVDAYLDIEIK